MSDGGPLGPPWSAGETVVFWSSNQHDPSSRCCGRRPSMLASLAFPSPTSNVLICRRGCAFLSG